MAQGALDRYEWEVKYQRREDMRVWITARAVREQLEQCVTDMRAIVERAVTAVKKEE